MGILLCSAELFCDKLLTQQQQQQPLFLQPLFLQFTVLHLPTSFPFLSWNGFTAFLFRLPLLSYPILSHVFPFPFLFLAFSILSYPILNAFTSIPNSLPAYPILSYPILCIPSFFFAYPMFISFTSLFSLPFLFNPILCCCIPSVSLHSLSVSSLLFLFCRLGSYFWNQLAGGLPKWLVD